MFAIFGTSPSFQHFDIKSLRLQGSELGFIVCEPGAKIRPSVPKGSTELDPIVLIDYIPENSFLLTRSSYLVALCYFEHSGVRKLL